MSIIMNPNRFSSPQGIYFNGKGENELGAGNVNNVIFDSNINISGNYTISIWINSEKADNHQLLSQGNTNANAIQFQPTQVIHRPSSGANFVINWGGVGVEPNLLKHLCFRRIGTGSSGTKGYKNAVKGTSGSVSGTATLLYRYLIRTLGLGSATWKGWVYELVIWNGYGASDSEITSLYNLGYGGDPSSIIASPSSYYKFNEKGNTVIDYGSNGINGTKINF